MSEAELTLEDLGMMSKPALIRMCFSVIAQRRTIAARVEELEGLRDRTQDRFNKVAAIGLKGQERIKELEKLVHRWSCAKVVVDYDDAFSQMQREMKAAEQPIKFEGSYPPPGCDPF